MKLPCSHWRFSEVSSRGEETVSQFQLSPPRAIAWCRRIRSQSHGNLIVRASSRPLYSQPTRERVRRASRQGRGSCSKNLKSVFLLPVESNEARTRLLFSYLPLNPFFRPIKRPCYKIKWKGHSKGEATSPLCFKLCIKAQTGH
jgi:hypothetical protein